MNRDSEEAHRVAHRSAIAALRAGFPPLLSLKNLQRAAAQSEDPALRSALERFQSTRNAYWLFAENIGITRNLCRSWIKTRRRAAPWLDSDTADAEATFGMGEIVSRHAEHLIPQPLALFARPWMIKFLDRWLATERGVPIGSGNEQRHDAAIGKGIQSSRISEALEDESQMNPEETTLFIERVGKKRY